MNKNKINQEMVLTMLVCLFYGNYGRMVVRKKQKVLNVTVTVGWYQSIKKAKKANKPNKTNNQRTP